MKVKTYITGKLYAEAKRDKWLNSLTYFVYLSANFRHKKFRVDQVTTLKKTTLYKHLEILQAKGLITRDKGVITLKSNKQFQGVFKLFTTKTDLHDIRNFLKQVPSISNIFYQIKIEAKKTYFRTLSENLHKENNNNTKSGAIRLNRFIKLREKKHRNPLKEHKVCLSIAGFARLNNLSQATACKLRKQISYLTDNLLQSKRDYLKVYDGECDKTLLKCFKENLPFVKLGLNCLFIDLATTYSLKVPDFA